MQSRKKNLKKSRVALMGCGLMQRPHIETIKDAEIVRIDIDTAVEPDIIFDCENLEKGNPIPDGPYDQACFFEVLEHFGKQGDYVGWFNTFNAIGDSLTEDGSILGTCPKHDSPWAWGDPGHTRVLAVPQCFFFFRPDCYGKQTSTNLYRSMTKYWWSIQSDSYNDHCMVFYLQKEGLNPHYEKKQ